MTIDFVNPQDLDTACESYDKMCIKYFGSTEKGPNHTLPAQIAIQETALDEPENFVDSLDGDMEVLLENEFPEGITQYTYETIDHTGRPFTILSNVSSNYHEQQPGKYGYNNKCIADCVKKYQGDERWFVKTILNLRWSYSKHNLTVELMHSRLS